ncbi:hypothetical protein B0H13DRAFT_1078038 [Mycena leptocephala]|nr:hypothetical protein B0H13DRAFT_1078038 [Mycena leptocephala]
MWHQIMASKSIILCIIVFLLSFSRPICFCASVVSVFPRFSRLSIRWLPEGLTNFLFHIAVAPHICHGLRFYVISLLHTSLRPSLLSLARPYL